MTQKNCFWTRQLELDLVNFVRARELIWKPEKNSNRHNQKRFKYSAYAEFAAKNGRGFTAQSVRDRWINIRSTFNYNLRKVMKTQRLTPNNVYEPCWPLWAPLQFLREDYKPDGDSDNNQQPLITIDSEIKTEIEQNRHEEYQSRHCRNIINNLIDAVEPFIEERPNSYMHFGHHVAERLTSMEPHNADRAASVIRNLMETWRNESSIR